MATSPVVGQIVLVPEGSTWKYLDDGSDQDTSWREIGFDDNSWAEGHAQLGYGDGDEATIVSQGPDSSNKCVTTYFRHSFDVNKPSQYVGLMLRLLRDEGGVVYLNGTEVVRSNMPAGTINYLSLAVSAVAGSNEDTFYKFFIDPSYLIDGINVLAVEIHQASVSSTDISFDLEFVTTTHLPGITLKAPYLIYTGNNTEMQVLYQLNSTAPCTIYEPSYVELNIFNVKGKKIKSLVKGKFEAGDHYFIWNGKNNVDQNASSGLYINRL